jgi:hypothetical protein
MSNLFAPMPGATGVPAVQPPSYAPAPQGGGVSYDPSRIPPPPGYNPQQPQGSALPGQPALPYGQPAPGQQPQFLYPQGYQPQVPAPVGYPQYQQQQPTAPAGPMGWQPSAPAPTQQPMPAPRAQLDDNTILDGPGVPPELRGRRWGEARQMWGAMSSQFMSGATPAQQQRMAPPAQQPPQGRPQAPQQFWSNPQEYIGAAVRQEIQQSLMPALAPVLQHTQANANAQARAIAMQGVADFQSLEADIMPIVANADPRSLASPETWIAAADIARGRRMRNQPAQPQRPQQWQPSAPTAYGPGAAQPAYTFFTEGPTAPAVPGGYGTPSAAQPSEQDVWHANKFNMPVAEYMAWKHGAAAPAGGRW